MPRAFLNDELVTRLRSIQREEYWDTSVGGLVLRVSGEAKTWWLLFGSPQVRSADGKAKRRRWPLGRWPEVSVGGARKEAKRLRVLIGKGIDPALQPDEAKRRTELTFGELGRLYIEEKAKPRKSTWRNDLWMLESVVGPYWANRPVSEVSPVDVQHLAQAVSQRAPILANRALTVIRQTFRLGVLKGLVPANPAASVPKPSQERARTRVLTPNEVVALWNASAKDPNPVAAVIRLRMLTAQRGGEILHLNANDLEPAPGGLWWNLSAEVTKSRRPHRLFLTPSAIEILQALKPSPFGWFFPQERDPTAPMVQSSHILYRMREASGTSGWVPKDIRRTAATLMSRNGVPRFVVRRVLNHSDNEVTAVYDLYEYDDEVRRALLILEKAIRDLLERGTQGLSTLVRSLPVGAGTTAEPAVELGFQPPGAVSGHLDRRWKLA